MTNLGVAQSQTNNTVPVLYDNVAGTLSASGKPLLNSSNAFYNGVVPNRLISYGDSITVNTAIASNSAAQIYASILAAKYAPYASFTPTAVSGVSHPAYLNSTLTGLVLNANDLVFGLPMFNTMRTLGPNPALIDELAPDIEAFLAWMAVPESLKVRAILRGTTTPNPLVTTTGNWAYFSLDGANLVNLCLRSATLGSTAAFPAVQGDTVYIWYARGTLSDSSFYNIQVDGQQYATSQFAAYNSWLGSFGNWVVSLLRITGLDPSISHKVTISLASGAVMNVIAVAGFNSGRLSQVNTIAPQAPAVVTGNCLKMQSGVSSSGYAFTGNTANDPLSQIAGMTLSAGSVTAAPFFYGHAGVAAYNQLIDKAVRNLQSDGLRVALVDLFNGYNTFNLAMVDPDTVHPNVGGMQWIATQLQQVMNPLFSGSIGAKLFNS